MAECFLVAQGLKKNMLRLTSGRNGRNGFIKHTAFIRCEEGLFNQRVSIQKNINML